MRKKSEPFGRFDPHYIWCKTNTPFDKQKIIAIDKHSGGTVMVGGFFAASGRLPENPEGEHLAISS